MADAKNVQNGTAIWYFVAATFLFLGAGTAMTEWSPIAGWAGFAIGLVVLVVGIVVFGRERAERRS